MAKHIWSVLCRKHLVDPGTKQVSLIDVIERVTLPEASLEKEAEVVGMPVSEMLAKGILFPLECQLLTFWSRSAESTPEVAALRIRLLGPKGKTLTAVDFEVSLEKHLNVRHTVTFPGLVFAGEGRYSLIIEKRGKGNRTRREAWIPLEMRIAADIPT